MAGPSANGWPPMGSGWPVRGDGAPPLVRNPRVGHWPHVESTMFGAISSECGSTMMNALPFCEDDFDFKCIDRVVHALVHGDYSMLTPEEEERLKVRMGTVDVSYFLKHVRVEYRKRMVKYDNLVRQAMEQIRVFHAMDRWTQVMLKTPSLGHLSDRAKLMLWGVAWHQASFDSLSKEDLFPSIPPRGARVSRVGLPYAVETRSG